MASFFTSRYENASSTRALQDFRSIRDCLLGKVARSSIPIFNEMDYPLPSLEELCQAGWPKRKETLARAILACSIKSGAFDIADGNQASRQRLESREYHHLFPDHILREEAGLSDRESSRALNCILITMSTNRNISAKDPLKYLGERIDRAQLGEDVVSDRLRSHIVPYKELKVGGYSDLPALERSKKIRSDYDAFIKKRAELVHGALTALTMGKNWPAEG